MPRVRALGGGHGGPGQGQAQAGASEVLRGLVWPRWGMGQQWERWRGRDHGTVLGVGCGCPVRALVGPWDGSECEVPEVIQATALPAGLTQENPRSRCPASCTVFHGQWRPRLAILGIALTPRLPAQDGELRDVHPSPRTRRHTPGSGWPWGHCSQDRTYLQCGEDLGI